MRASSRKRAQARRHLEATAAAMRLELSSDPSSWLGYRAIEQLIEAAEHYLQATAPQPRGRQSAPTVEPGATELGK